MTIDNDAFTSNSIHYNHFAYRTKIADFNGDGYDDIDSEFIFNDTEIT